MKFAGAKFAGRLFIYGSILLISVFFAIICATTGKTFKLVLCVVSATVMVVLIFEEILWQIKRRREKERRSESKQPEEDVPEELRVRVGMKEILQKKVDELEDLKKTLPQQIKEAEERLEQVEEEIEEEIEEVERHNRKKEKEKAVNDRDAEKDKNKEKTK